MGAEASLTLTRRRAPFAAMPAKSSAPRSRQLADAQQGVVRIGTQGWNYEGWVGAFYPVGTRPADFLSIYSRAFDTVEVDSTFYAIPPSKTVRGWADRTPPGFTFALKMPQEITHERRLRDNCREPHSGISQRERSSFHSTRLLLSKSQRPAT